MYRDIRRRCADCKTSSTDKSKDHIDASSITRRYFGATLYPDLATAGTSAFSSSATSSSALTDVSSLGRWLPNSSDPSVVFSFSTLSTVTSGIDHSTMARSGTHRTLCPSRRDASTSRETCCAPFSGSPWRSRRIPQATNLISVQNVEKRSASTQS
jgi:hypothetical protein